MMKKSPTFQEKVNTALAKPEDQRTPEEKLMLQAFEDAKRQALADLKGE